MSDKKKLGIKAWILNMLKENKGVKFTTMEIREFVLLGIEGLEIESDMNPKYLRSHVQRVLQFLKIEGVIDRVYVDVTKPWRGFEHWYPGERMTRNELLKKYKLNYDTSNGCSSVEFYSNEYFSISAYEAEERTLFKLIATLEMMSEVTGFVSE